MHHPSRFFCMPAGFRATAGKRARLVCGIFFLLAFAVNLHGQVNFGTQVVPFFSSTGCTGCHGASGGLTLTGSTSAIYNEVRNEVGPSGQTRVNVGSSSNSLILTKPSAGPPSTSHAGGKFAAWATNQTAYTTTLAWIQEGALLNPRSLSRSPASMSFNATVGGANPSNQTLQIQNVGDGAMSWSVSDNQTWLSLSPTSGSSTGEIDNVTVSVNIGGLGAGTHTATITITGTTAVNSPQTTTVTLTLGTSPTILRNPASMSFFAPVGGANPATQTLGISNSGSGTLNWSVSDDQPWLSLSPTSGSSTGETDNVTVSVNIAGLAIGNYTGTITISAPGATNTPQTTAVTLNVTSGVDFFDDFSDGNADGWQPAIPSRWQVQPVSGNNAYCIITADPVDDEFSYLITRTWSDFVMELDARATGTTNRNYSILFNTQNTNNPSGYYLQFAFNAVNLFGQGGSLLTSVTGRDFVTDGQYHHIRIERQFPSIRVLADNQLIFQLNNTVYASGFIGLNSFRGTACFDNIAITSLTPNPVPTLSNLAPASGNRLQTLNVVFTGTNFISGVTSVNAGSDITVNSVTVANPAGPTTNSTSLTANLTIGANAATGPRNFSVTNRSPGGGTSGNQTFMVTNPAPSLTSLTPSAGNRSQTLDVVFTGTNFFRAVTSVNAGADITVNSITVTSEMSLRANLTIGANAATGLRNFFVTNSGPGGGTSNGLSFTINDPAPTLGSIVPATGNRLQTLDVIFTGTNFINGVTAVNVGADITVNSTTVTSSTSLIANLTIGANAAIGPRNFSVTNSGPGGGTSGNLIFTVNDPGPTLSSIAPTTGNRLQTLDVLFTGANFINGVTTVNVGSGITVNSTSVTNSTSLTANLTISANAATGPRNFSVTNSGATSASQTFTVNNPAPSLTNIAPASGNAGQTLDVVFTGTNFINGVTTVNVGAGITVNSTTVASATGLTANLTIATNAGTGPRNFTVTNSGPGGGASATQTFTVMAIQTARVIRAVNASASPGGTVDVAVELASQGDENAFGFSLVFDPAILSNPQARVGRDAMSASLNVNASQQNQGRFGIALALPTGQRFSAGARELVVVNFAVTAATAAVSTPVDFGDQPIMREVADVNANSLPANWVAGTITFTRGFEADVSPRPSGNNNGTVTIADWVQLGRFSAGLEIPRTDVNEFQRADCAPKPCGDARVSIADWVQAGLYAAGLDPVVAACGPLSSNLNLAEGKINHTAVSAVRAINTVFTRGRMDTLLVELETSGAVNAAGFGLTFDSAVLAFEKVLPGNDARGATLHVNSSQKANGQIGIALALTAGQSFAPGGCQLVQVVFAVLPGSAASSTRIAFSGQPIAQEVVSTDATVLQTAWKSAMITLQNSTSVESSAEGVPVAFELGQNYPNPFSPPGRGTFGNPSTMIHFALPQATPVSLKIFSVLGEEIAVLVDQELAAGRYDVRWEAQDAKSGVYLYRLQAGSWSQTRKLMFMR